MSRTPASISPPLLPGLPEMLMRSRLDGPQTLFNGPGFWAVALALCLALFLYPLVGSPFGASNLSSFLLNVPLALGLSLLWGYCGVLSFGQMAFFGLAGYSYGVIAINLGGGNATLLAAAAAIGLTMLVGLVIGYFIFYGRVSSWIVPVLTLVLTLVLETFLGQTAGYDWQIGEALLGGYNGMTNIPSLEVAGLQFNGFTFPIYFLVLAASIGLYLAARVLVNSHIGYVLVAIREDAERAELLGYDVRRYRLGVFTLAAGLAALSGVFYVSWGNYITPSTVGLLAATMPVLWVAVGGKASLTAVALSTVAIEALSDWLSVYSGEFAFIFMGALLVLGMSFAPDGILVTGARRLFVRGGRAP